MALRMSGPASLTSQAACRVAEMRRPEREEEDFFRSLGNISHRVKELIAPFFQLRNLNEILERNLQPVAELLLRHRVRPGNDALIYAALLGDAAGVERFLTGAYPPGLPRPDQGGVNGALEYAAIGGHVALVERLLTGAHPEGLPRPDQRGVNRALRAAASKGHVVLVERLLTGAYPEGLPRPGQRGVNVALESAARKGHVAVVELLRAHLAR